MIKVPASSRQSTETSQAPVAPTRVMVINGGHDIWKYRGGGRAPVQLAWLSRRSDEFIAAADPGGVELEDDEALAFISRVR